MSQYPYQPPPSQYPDYYGQPYDDPLAPARRAGVLMYVLAALTVVGALCCAGMGALVPQLMERPEFAQEIQRYPEFNTDMLRTILIVAAVVTLVVAVVLGVLGSFVRRGSKVAIILSLILSVLVILYLVLSLVGSMAQSGGAMAVNQVIGTICVMGIPAALFALLIVWLIQALRASSDVAAMQQQYQQQAWQQAYNQQAYQQGGIPSHGGFPPPPGYQPPPPPPPRYPGDHDAPPPQR